MSVWKSDYINMCMGTSLVVQWLGLHASTAGCTGLVPDRRIGCSERIALKQVYYQG